jgi:hypothetical protein
MASKGGLEEVPEGMRPLSGFSLSIKRAKVDRRVIIMRYARFQHSLAQISTPPQDVC